MVLRRLKPFTQNYAKLPAAIRKKVDRKLQYLAQDLRHPGLSARKMTGQDDIWEARVDEHYRMTFRIVDDTIVLRAVGTHEIYRKP